MRKKFITNFIVTTPKFKLKNEIKILPMLRSPHVPKLFNVVFDRHCIYMVQQCAGKRTLKNFFKRYKSQIQVGNLI